MVNDVLKKPLCVTYAELNWLELFSITKKQKPKIKTTNVSTFPLQLTHAFQFK